MHWTSVLELDYNNTLKNKLDTWWGCLLLNTKPAQFWNKIRKCWVFFKHLCSQKFSFHDQKNTVTWKSNFWLVIQNAFPGTSGEALRLLGNDPVTSAVGWQWCSSPGSQISLCAQSHFPSAEACPAGVGFLGQCGRVSAALPAGLAAEMQRLESPSEYLGTPGASTGLAVCAQSKQTLKSINF